jgi:uncharacterized protein
MATGKTERGRKRRARRPRAWWRMLLAVAVAVVAAVLWLRPRSLPAPPRDLPRFIVPPPARAFAPDAPAPRASAADETHALPHAEARVRVAIVIDDLGDSIEAARAVLALEAPVTVAVIPFRPESARIAAAAVEHGREVILHLPLEPERSDDMGAAPGFLRAGMSSAALERQLEADLRAVPYIVGVNGHMGSRFTQDPQSMERLLRALQTRGLFFLDSLTTPSSVAAVTAGRIGLPFAQRTLFLDHDPAPAAVAAALGELDAILHDGGDAIAIGHPHRVTTAALAAWLPRAAGRGVRVVPLSAMVR